MEPTIACVVPCHNEEAAVGKVVRDLRSALPEADIYVYDNASTDRTVEVAREAGAIIRQEPHKGKGNVIRRAFADVDADALLIIDGDDTYDASRARDMVDLLFEGPYDQVVGARHETVDGAYRAGHAVGNKVLSGAVRCLFGKEVTDMLSGYRVFSRRFVKSFPALSRQFETETEMTVHALNLRLPTARSRSPTELGRPEARANCAPTATAGASSESSSISPAVNALHSCTPWWRACSPSSLSCSGSPSSSSSSARAPSRASPRQSSRRRS